MRLSRKQRNHGIGFDITPMIDVVFQLIIFFMTCSQTAAVDRAAVNLPKLPGAADPTRRDITITVQANGNLLMLNQPVSLADIGAKVKAVAAERGGPDRLMVALRVDAAATSAVPNQVIKALVAQGVRHGGIAVEAATLTGE